VRVSAPTATADLLARIRAEIDARMAQLRPAIDERERLLEAAGALASSPEGELRIAPRRRAPARRPPARRSAAQQAIAAALEHGSHTVAELAVVTALPGADIREGLRRLQRAGAVTRTRRDDRTAYVLSDRA
jgi:predicted Rossmann fold nucleotide-binding protein DprA/Smf involved in DNA uptake